MPLSFLRSRYLILVCAVLMQTCLGATYSWSIFVNPLRELLGLKQGGAQVPFTVFYMVFPATALFAGPAMARLTPRGSAMLGGLVFGGGWILAGLGARGFAWTALGIGVLAGIGVGLAYVVPIATCIQWFPRQKGLVTGIAVAGFGGGAAAVSQVGDWLMSAHGMSPFEVFRALGVAYMMIVCTAGLAMRRPPIPNKVGQRDNSSNSPSPAGACGPSMPSAAASAGRPRFLEVIAQRPFRVLYLAMFCGLAAGFMVNANLKQLSAGASSKAGVTAVSLFALANALGRIGWGAAFDRVSRPHRILQANLLFQASLLLAAVGLLRSTWGLQMVALAAGFNYGGVLVLYASSVAARWGPDKVGHVYGWLFSSNIPASLAPLLAALVFDLKGTFTLPLLMLAGLLVVGSGLIRGGRWGREKESERVGV